MSAHPYRSHTAGELRPAHVGQRVRLSGWVHAIRDHGALVFVDLRDRHGRTQVVFKDTDAALYARARELRAEWVITVDGAVGAREKANPELATGAIEVVANALVVLTRPTTLPLEVNSTELANEELRFKYRHLDLRRPEIVARFVLRHKIVKQIHRHFDESGFVEVETPILNRATPEGARDFLVPSRLHAGQFYALPQSPQLMKQILMIAGLDRYYQVARCFRDEDLRADRQPEFTQLDLEMSFVTPEDIYAVIEGLFARIYREVLGRPLTTPFRRLGYDEAMSRYGVDKPDTRFGLELVDLGAIAPGCGFGVFEKAVGAGGQVKAIRVPGGGKYSRKDITELEAEAKEVGAKGLAWLKGEGGSLGGSSAKFFAPGALAAIRTTMAATDGDLVLAVADAPSVVAAALGRLRGVIARREGLIPAGREDFLWVVDFPMFAQDEPGGAITFQHHPFTQPREADLPRLESEPLSVRSHAYDLVLNGYELGGGSLRNHRRDVQERVFGVLGFKPEAARAQFGFFLDCLEHGAPPHGGIALGVDRIAMLLSGCDSIREVMAFPKTTRGTCLLTQAPSAVEGSQLADLSIAIARRDAAATSGPAK